MTSITAGHLADLEYIKETTAGSEPTTGTLQIPSDVVTNVSLNNVNNAEILYSIGDYDGVSTVTGAQEVVLTFDFIKQKNNSDGQHQMPDSIEYFAVTRTRGQPTASLTFYYSPLTGSTSCTYMINGAYINSYSETVNEGDKTIKCSVEVWGYSCATSNSHYTSLTAASAIGNDYEQYCGATVTKNSATVGKGVKEFNFTVENNLERIPVVGDSALTAIYASNQVMSGSTNILVEDGGAIQYGKMSSAESDSIEYNSGNTSGKSETWTFGNAVFTNMPIENSADTPYVISNANWIARSVSLAEKS